MIKKLRWSKIQIRGECRSNCPCNPPRKNGGGCTQLAILSESLPGYGFLIYRRSDKQWLLQTDRPSSIMSYPSLSKAKEAANEDWVKILSPFLT